MDLSTRIKSELSSYSPQSLTPNKFQLIAPLPTPVSLNTSATIPSPSSHFQSPSLSSQSILAQHVSVCFSYNAIKKNCCYFRI